jgi:hypothetical protein
VANAREVSEEGPEPSPDRIEQWLFTLDSITGEVYRVEKLDRGSGKHHELSESEYAALSGYLDEGQSSAGAIETESSARESTADDPYAMGYFQGLADYEAAAFQAAYLQGMADCAKLLG